MNNFCLPEMTCVLYLANTAHALAIQQDRVVETVWTLDRDSIIVVQADWPRLEVAYKP